jgi:Fic family protein
MSNFNREIPYNDLPLLPPKADIETKIILRKTISAGRALAQLNGTLLNLPNPTLFLDTIYLQDVHSGDIDPLFREVDPLR